MPRITIGVIPFTAPFETATTSFLMFDSKMVLVENITAELNLTQPHEIKVYHRTFDVLADQSVTGEQARRLIRKALDARTPPTA